MPRADTVSTGMGTGAAGAARGTWGVALLGMLYYALSAFGITPFEQVEAFGTDIYDRYYLAILDGRLDLPARVLRLEGHYRPDGTGYIYHGLAPLLTRFAFGWALPLPQVSLSAFSVWLWAVLGTAAYHLAFVTAARRLWPDASVRRALWAVALAVAIWFAGPGVIVAARPSLYHEPIAVAYALTGLFVLVWMRAAVLQRPWGWGLVALALCAGLVVHARPNLAVGLYLGTLIAVVLAWRQGRRQGRRQALLPAVLALALLAASGVGYLGLNSLRFGDPTTTHGSFEASSVQHGAVFWGWEEANSDRAAAFIKHGRFNVQRIAPNLMLYTLDMPDRAGLRLVSAPVRRLFEAWTLPRLGYIRVEEPRFGMGLMWTCWLLVAFAAVFARRVPRPLFGLAVAAGAAATVTLAYATITLRYRVDLWPLIAVLAGIGLFAVVPRLARGNSIILPVVLCLGIASGAGMSAFAAHSYARNFGTYMPFFAPWSEAECAARVVKRGLPEARIRPMCSLGTASGEEPTA